MYKVKLSIALDNEKCNRQLPKCGFIWKDYEFFINQDCEEADFWVVYSKGRRMAETCRVAPQNTMLITGEPDSVYHFSNGFVKQFGKVVSCQQGLKHNNLVHNQPAQPWHIGKLTKKDNRGKENQVSVEYSQTYDTLKISKPPKTKLMSIITSNKSFTKGHRERIDFVMKLKAHYGDQLDLFGFGFNDFADKWDAIAPYKYHIALENCSIPDYWTEKLADTYLGNAFPIYYGCKNIVDYFSKESFLTIDIHDVDGAIEIIDNAIREDFAGRRAQAVEESKQLVLEKYNLFNLIVEQLQDMDINLKKCQVTLKEDTAFIDFQKIYVMIVKRLWNVFSSKFSK